MRGYERTTIVLSRSMLWRTLAVVGLATTCFILMLPVAISPARVSDVSDSPIVATVGNHSITLVEAERQVALALYQLDQQRTQLLLFAVQQLIDSELLQVEAARTGKSIEQLLGIPRSSIDAGHFSPAPTQAHAFDNANALSQRRQALLASLRRQTSVHLSLPRITEPVLAVSTDDDPSVGPASAPVTIVEFSDFQCPFCKQSAQVVKQLLRTYGQRVRFVYRDYPAPNHRHAKHAAEAAQCAAAQGKFWAYHDLLFEYQKPGAGWDFYGLAQEASLDVDVFSRCLDTHQYASEVESDFRDALNLGVMNTPTFFVNGRPLIGARSFNEFQTLIDQALAEPH